MEKIITAVFNVESEGYQAITELKNTPSTDSYFVSQAVLVKKENDRVTVLDSFDTGYETANDAAIGGLIGATVGILGGPLGMLLGGSIGILAGSAVDAGDANDNASILEQMTELFVENEVAVLALAQENEEGALQKVLSKYDVSVIEEDAALVAEEVRYAEVMQKDMELKAKKALRAERKEDRKQAVEEHREKIKADFDARKQKKADKKAEKAAAKEAKKAGEQS